jgi:hypothetical protein
MSPHQDMKRVVSPLRSPERFERLKMWMKHYEPNNKSPDYDASLKQINLKDLPSGLCLG